LCMHRKLRSLAGRQLSQVGGFSPDTKQRFAGNVGAEAPTYSSNLQIQQSSKR